jgi:hypothetical protein
MIMGIPGTGIGGLFYLFAALLMPVIELVQTARGCSSKSRWREVGLQSGVALGIIFLTLASLELLWLFLSYLPADLIAQATNAREQELIPWVFRLPPLLMALPTLGAVLIALELLALPFGRKVHAMAAIRKPKHVSTTVREKFQRQNGSSEEK